MDLAQVTKATWELNCWSCHPTGQYICGPVVDFIQTYPVVGLSEKHSACAGPEDHVVEFCPEDSSPPVSSGPRRQKGLSDVHKEPGCCRSLAV